MDLRIKDIDQLKVNDSIYWIDKPNIIWTLIDISKPDQEERNNWVYRFKNPISLIRYNISFYELETFIVHRSIYFKKNKQRKKSRLNFEE